MISTGDSRKRVGFIWILAGFLCEAAAALPFVAPEVIWATAGQSFWLHLVAALLGGGGAAALVTAGRGIRPWAGLTGLFTLFAFVVPGAGLFGILLLTLILVSHYAQEPPKKIALVEVRARRRPSESGSALFGPGPVREPLAGTLSRIPPAELQKIVLGMEAMPPAATRPILQKLQRHPDVRVQLYANGLLNDHLDVLERRLAILKQRVKKDPADEATQTAVVESYLALFGDRLVAADEEAQIAGQALRETERLLSLNAANATGLGAHVEFRLLRGEYRDAAMGIERLRQLPGESGRAAGLEARLRFDYAASQDLPAPTAPTPAPATDSRTRPAKEN